jgi:hypothetical protein
MSTPDPTPTAQAAGSEPWIPCKRALPPDKVVVETKVDDAKGVRNVQTLIRHRGLWWFEDMSMYVYYSPTHWRILPPNAERTDRSAGSVT